MFRFAADMLDCVDDAEIHNRIAAARIRGSIVQAGAFNHVTITGHGPGPGDHVVVPRQLPGTVRDFTGRTEYARRLDSSTERLADEEFREQEVAAVAVTEETNGSFDAVKTLHARGYSVTVVSNNSVDAATSYLHKHKLERYAIGISARSVGSQPPQT